MLPRLAKVVSRSVPMPPGNVISKSLWAQVFAIAQVVTCDVHINRITDASALFNYAGNDTYGLSPIFPRIY